MTSPAAPEARCRLHNQENLWPMSAHSLRMLHKAGPCLCSACEDRRSDNVQDPAISNPPVTAALLLPPSSLVSACLSCLPTVAAKDSELSSHEVLPNTGPYLRSPSLTRQPSQRAKNLYGNRSRLIAIPVPLPLGICDPPWRVKLLYAGRAHQGSLTIARIIAPPSREVQQPTK
jgi:hypothetical protein